MLNDYILLKPITCILSLIFLVTIINGPTFDKTPEEFNQMIKEIIENR